MINDGALKEDFKTELLGVYSKDECLEREKELAKTSLFPKGLNGNAGKYIEMTDEVKEKISKAARKTQRKRIEEGTHNFLGKNNPSHKRVENGTHPFLGPENNRKRIEARYSSSIRSRIK